MFDNFINNIRNHFNENSLENVKDDLADLKEEIAKSPLKQTFEKSTKEIEIMMQRKENLKKARDIILNMQEIVKKANSDFKKPMTKTIRELIQNTYSNLALDIRDGEDISETKEIVEKVIDMELKRLKDSFDFIGEKTIRDYMENCIDIKGHFESIYETKEIELFLDTFTIEYLDLIGAETMPNTNLEYLDIDYEQLKEIIKKVQKKSPIQDGVSFKIKDTGNGIETITLTEIQEKEKKIIEVKKQKPKQKKENLIKSKLKESPKIKKVKEKQEEIKIPNLKEIKKAEQLNNKDFKIFKERGKENFITAKIILDKAINELKKIDEFKKLNLSKIKISTKILPLIIKESHLKIKSISSAKAIGLAQITNITELQVNKSLNLKLDRKKPFDNMKIAILYYFSVLPNMLEKYTKNIDFKAKEKDNFIKFSYNLGPTKTNKLINEYLNEKKVKTIKWDSFIKFLLQRNGLSGEYKTTYSEEYAVYYRDFYYENIKESYREPIDYVEIIKALEKKNFEKKGNNSYEKIAFKGNLYEVLAKNKIEPTTDNIKIIEYFNKNLGNNFRKTGELYLFAKGNKIYSEEKLAKNLKDSYKIDFLDKNNIGNILTKNNFKNNFKNRKLLKDYNNELGNNLKYAKIVYLPLKGIHKKRLEENFISYIVKKGDTFYKISNKLGFSIKDKDKIIAYNKYLGNPINSKEIKIGIPIFFPGNIA